MEKLIILGETSRTVSTFGIPILVDSQERFYQKIQPQYEKLLRKNSSLVAVKAFDFKLKRARGKKWPEPPRVGELLTFHHPRIEGELCTGIVNYIHLGRRRSVGVVYLEEWCWTSAVLPDFTNGYAIRTTHGTDVHRRC